MPDPRFRAVRWTPPRASRPVPRRADPRTLPPLRMIPLPGAGPEHVAFDAAGNVIAGLDDGRVVCQSPDATDAAAARVLADTGGRPLGIERYGEDAFVVCDADRGLLLLETAAGEPSIEVLCDKVDGEPLTLCSNAAIAADGSVYFTQSSRRFDLAHYKGDLLEHSGTGRVLRYRGPAGGGIAGGEAEVLLDGLHFANGVVLSPDESSLVVAETGAYRLTRLWIAGDKAGTSEPLIDGLPGFPDNLTTTAEGVIWVAMVSPRDALLDWLHPRSPRLRSLVWSVPDRLLPGPKDLAWVMAVDQSGGVLHDLRGWRTGYRAVTAVRHEGGKLYLGSLTADAVAVLDLAR